jgi:hypothetical protein
MGGEGYLVFFRVDAGGEEENSIETAEDSGPVRRQRNPLRLDRSNFIRASY